MRRTAGAVLIGSEKFTEETYNSPNEAAFVAKVGAGSRRIFNNDCATLIIAIFIVSPNQRYGSRIFGCYGHCFLVKINYICVIFSK